MFEFGDGGFRLIETLWRSTSVDFYKTTLATTIESDGLKAVSVTVETAGGLTPYQRSA